MPEFLFLRLLERRDQDDANNERHPPQRDEKLKIKVYGQWKAAGSWAGSNKGEYVHNGKRGCRQGVVLGRVFGFKNVAPAAMIPETHSRNDLDGR
jgi:hypothetical protein